ncbi:MAG: hypothetical protein A2172_00170 [Candidatus Woykebacteria bacterium RBG_13_40_15]|uniref:Uncharacterized protein n=1 Tax=Candidatus Woykebacteria bacterium RBG_13_40_15 TaxID=1802593 RepID=A0A1G1W9H6_9BACT|nr:MAG: hypothetical protein A2172_00170 [Candidatus Woykebacteria bacterium RBG_13_40_15]
MALYLATKLGLKKALQGNIIGWQAKEQMKKLFLFSLGVLLLIAFLFIGFYIGTKRNSKSSDLKTSNTNSVVSKTNSSDTQEKTKAKEVDLKSLMERLKSKFPAIRETKIYTEENDPYDMLGKPKWYIAGAAFWDERTNYTVTEGEKWGTAAGGSVAVYRNKSDAVEGAAMLEAAQGGVLDPGQFRRVDNILIRVSRDLTNSQQVEILNYLESQLN